MQLENTIELPGTEPEIGCEMKAGGLNTRRDESKTAPSYLSGVNWGDNLRGKTDNLRGRTSCTGGGSRCWEGW